MLLLLLSLLLLWPAQNGQLRGYVDDTVTGERLVGATVVLERAGSDPIGTATDGDGFYLLPRVPAGTYQLRVSFIGYEPFVGTVRVSDGETTDQDVRLQPATGELGEVLVEAVGASGVTAVAAGLQTVRPADIERALMPGATGDLASYLLTVPGVVAQGDRGGQLFVRGGAADQNLVLLDGLPVYAPFHVLGFYSAFPDEIVGEAELYTGGFGARYGTRMSSVLDVQARNGGKRRFAASASIAPFLSTVRVEGPIVPGRVSVLASVRESLLENVMTEMFGQSFPYRFGDRFGKIHAFVTASTSVSVTGLSTHDRGELAGSSKTFTGDGVASVATDTSNVTWGNTVVGGQIDHRSSRLPLRVQLVGGWSGADNTFGPPDTPTRVSEIESVDAALHAEILLDWPVRLGGTRRATTLAYALAGQFEQPDETAEATLTEWTAYAETDVRAGPVTVTPGLHVFHLSERNETGVEPRIRVTWRPTEPVRIDLAAGRYHQAIAGVNDQRDVGSVFTAWIPVPTTDPLPTATHVVAGSSVQVRPWLSVDAEAFWKQYDELAVPFFTAFPRFNTRLQPAEGDAVGLDLRADFDGYPFLYESALDGYVSYGLSRVEYRSPQATYPPPHDRRHQFNAVLRATRGDVGLTVQLQAGSGLPFTPSGGFDRWYPFDPSRDVTTAQGDVRVLYGEPFSSRQPAYQRVDVWLEHRFEQGRIAGALRGGVINLLNRKNLFYFDLFTLQRVDQLPLTPSVGIKLEVR